MKLSKTTEKKLNENGYFILNKNEYDYWVTLNRLVIDMEKNKTLVDFTDLGRITYNMLKGWT